jgi:hypothetical protein
MRLADAPSSVEGHGDQGVVVCQQLRPDAAHVIGQFAALGPDLPEGDAVGEHGPQAGFAQRLHGSISVLGSLLDVGDVLDGGDSSPEGGQRAEQVPQVHVPGQDRRPHSDHDVSEIVVEGVVRSVAAHYGLPHVAVGVDESRNDDTARSVDLLARARGLDPAPDLADLTSLNQDVALFEVAHIGIHREDAPRMSVLSWPERRMIFLQFSRSNIRNDMTDVLC